MTGITELHPAISLHYPYQDINWIILQDVLPAADRLPFTALL